MSTCPCAEVDAIEQLVIAGVASTGRALGGHDGIDLTFPQWRVLVVLGDSSVGATVKNVADEIGVTMPATSRQLRRLEGRGLVKIEPDADRSTCDAYKARHRKGARAAQDLRTAETVARA